MARDSQRGRLYRAENAFFAGLHRLHPARQEMPAANVQGFVESVCRLQVYAQLTMGGGCLVRAQHSPRLQGARAHGDWGVTVGPTSRLPWILLHELAHTAVSAARQKVREEMPRMTGLRPVASHGREFAWAYCRLVEAVFGKEVGSGLRRAFAAGRVRHRWSGNWFDMVLPEGDEIAVAAKPAPPRCSQCRGFLPKSGTCGRCAT